MVNLIYTILPIITLIVGFYFGFKIGKQNEIPKVEIKTPKKIIDDCKKEKKTQKDNEELEQYLANIDNFPNNQISFKR